MMKAERSEKILNMARASRDRFGLAAAFLAAVALFCSTASSLASPTDTITRAVLASGAPSVKEARASAFINAFSSVAIRVKDKDLPSYVSTAVTLRPDLADKIVAAALKSRPPETRLSLELIDRIVKVAIAAAPDAKRAIVRAALETCPWARKCILAAAGIDENEIAFFRLRDGINSTTIGAINSENIGGGGNTQSPEQPPAP